MGVKGEFIRPSKPSVRSEDRRNVAGCFAQRVWGGGRLTRRLEKQKTITTQAEDCTNRSIIGSHIKMPGMACVGFGFWLGLDTVYLFLFYMVPAGGGNSSPTRTKPPSRANRLFFACHTLQHRHFCHFKSMPMQQPQSNLTPSSCPPFYVLLFGSFRLPCHSPLRKSKSGSGPMSLLDVFMYAPRMI